jgi:hypothetical protein
MRALVIDNDKAICRLAEWAVARKYRLEALRAMHACGTCEYRERGDVDEPGRASCYMLYSRVDDEWCDTCCKREPLFREMLDRKRIEKAAFRRLCALVERSVEPLSPDARFTPVDKHQATGSATNLSAKSR